MAGFAINACFDFGGFVEELVLHHVASEKAIVFGRAFNIRRLFVRACFAFGLAFFVLVQPGGASFASIKIVVVVTIPGIGCQGSARGALGAKLLPCVGVVANAANLALIVKVHFWVFCWRIGQGCGNVRKLTGGTFDAA